MARICALLVAAASVAIVSAQVTITSESEYTEGDSFAVELTRTGDTSSAETATLRGVFFSPAPSGSFNLQFSDPVRCTAAFNMILSHAMLNHRL